MRISCMPSRSINHAIVRGIKRREPGVDFLSAHQSAQLEGMQDQDVLAFAAREGRVLISHDFRTMPRHFREFVHDHSSPGVFLISQALRRGRTPGDLGGSRAQRMNEFEVTCIAPLQP